MSEPQAPYDPHHIASTTPLDVAQQRKRDFEGDLLERIRQFERDSGDTLFVEFLEVRRLDISTRDQRSSMPTQVNTSIKLV